MRCKTLLFAVSALLTGALACRGGDGQAPRERVVVSPAWDTVFRVASSADDSTLLMPFRPVAGPGGVYVADYYADRILHFDGHGTLLWQFGRKGSGPDEFRRIRDVKVDSAGHIWILDQGNLRATVLDSSGAVLQRVPLDRVGRMPQLLIPLGGGDALLAVDRTDTPFVRIRQDGSVVGTRTFPWRGYRDLNFLAAQFTSATLPGTGSWVAAMQMGDGFFAFRSTGWSGYHGSYVERVTFPEVQEDRTGNGVATHFKVPPTRAGESVTMSPDRLYVLFGGTGPYARRIVDTYSLADGRYLLSIVLPHRVDAIGWGDGGLYVVYNTPYPTLAYWRPRQTHLP